jgi:hypothetical protein
MDFLKKLNKKRYEIIASTLVSLSLFGMAKGLEKSLFGETILIEEYKSYCNVLKEETGFRGYETRSIGDNHVEITKMSNMAYELNNDGSIKRLVGSIDGSFDNDGNFKTYKGIFERTLLPGYNSFEGSSLMCKSYVLKKS